MSSLLRLRERWRGENKTLSSHGRKKERVSGGDDDDDDDDVGVACG